MAGYDADLYASVHRGSEGDIAFYGAFCQGAPRVLELGCGLGRVLATLDTPDRERLVGLDIDPSYVERARVAAPGAECVVHDMRDFALDEQFDRIVAPFSSLYCMLSEDDLVTCFATVRQHLTQDGRFAFDVWPADAFHRDGPDGTDDDLDPVARFTLGGVGWTVYERSAWDRSTQRIDATYLHVSPDRYVEATIAHRYFTSDQLPELLARGGLTLEAAFGGFTGQPFDEDAESLVVIARPAP